MSASAWVTCPKCEGKNPAYADQPDSEYYGATRVDADFGWGKDKFSFSVKFWCTECFWSLELNETTISELI